MNQTLTLEEPFEIDKDWIKEDFYANYNNNKREWYFKTFSEKETSYYRQEFYDYIKHYKINVLFFAWFEPYCEENNIKNPFVSEKTIGINVRLNTQWKTSKGETIDSVHPPLEAFKFTPHKEKLC